jgi:hypothetical protein
MDVSRRAISLRCTAVAAGLTLFVLSGVCDGAESTSSGIQVEMDSRQDLFLRAEVRSAAPGRASSTSGFYRGVMCTA